MFNTLLDLALFTSTSYFAVGVLLSFCLGRERTKKKKPQRLFQQQLLQGDRLQGKRDGIGNRTKGNITDAME